MKIERKIWSNFVKSIVNETLGHINKAIQSK